ncbi:MAG: hypothetical protein FJ202_05040 [Gemmatimonadetes bacterium]|nr:hypothetical protein [Gemmatimonadota bacterium]
MRRAALVALAFVAAVPALATPAAAQSHVLIVSGLGGEPRFAERFRTLGAQLTAAMRARYGIADANIAWLGEDSTNAEPRYRGRSTRDAVEREMAAIRVRARPGEQVVLMFIGHGSDNDVDSKLSVPGTDVGVTDVKRWFEAMPLQRLAFVNLSSGSGDFLRHLAAPGRVIITATKTSYERNESRFGEHFVAALARDVADVDKDGRTSLLEAFRYAARETKRLYDDASRLQSEHSQLDDNGSTVNTAEPDGRTGQGALARRFFLDARAIPAAAAGDARLAGLYQERFELEERVDSLRLKKASLAEDAYYGELERVLVALARKAREIRQAEGRP